MDRFPPALHDDIAALLAGCSHADGSIRLRACPGVLCTDLVARDLPTLSQALYCAAFQYLDPAHPSADSAAWQTVRGRCAATTWEQADLLRVYFNARPRGIQTLLRILPPTLDRHGLPHVFKALHSDAVPRRDSAVLYLPLRFRALLQEILRDVVPALRPGDLRAATPLFTCAWQPGIAWAEQPSDGQSFGQHRCAMLAQALVEGWPSSLDGARRAERVAAVFRRSGVDPAEPHGRVRAVDYLG